MSGLFEQQQTEELTQQETEELTQQEKQDHLRDEATIQEHLFEARKCFAALLRIKQRRSYRPTYSTFERYVEVKWADLFNDISRMQLWRQMKHEETLQAFEAENVTRALQIDPPTSLRQSEALASLPPQERPYALELARETYGEKPTGPEVASTVAALRPSTDERISRLDTDRKAKPVVEPPPTTPGRSAYRKGFHVSAFKYDPDSRRVHFEVFKPANKWKGYDAKRENLQIDLVDLEWELRNIGFVLRAIGEDEQNAADYDCPDPAPVSPQASLDALDVPRDVAGKPLRPKMLVYHQKRGLYAEYPPPTEAELAANVFDWQTAAAENVARAEEDDEPLPGSFASADMNYADAPVVSDETPADSFFKDYPQ